jgi:hypothetical protein
MRSIILCIMASAIHAAALAQGAGQRESRPPAGSRWAPEHGPSQRAPLAGIVRDIRMQFGGQMLDAQEFAGRYLISWISGDGRRLEIEADLATGRIISVRG